MAGQGEPASSGTVARLANGVRDGWSLAAPVRRVIGKVAVPVTALGWTILALGAVSWWVGARLGWEELLVVAAACLLAVGASLLWTVGRLGVDVDADVSPQRVVVGGDAVGRVIVRNPRTRPSLGSRVEVPVGRSIASFEIGPLAAGAAFEEPFIVPTHRRAVIRIGPARSVKGDPLGIARRDVEGGAGAQLFVHPVTTPLPPFTTGWMRDLEGQTTNDLSPSDVAFHTLREYVAGDDRRHIHWRTSARLGTLMVRQFVDTRRAHLGVVLATDPQMWGSDGEFELGVSVAGSLGRTVLLEEQEVSVVTGERLLPSATPSLLLDGLAGVELAPVMAPGGAVQRTVMRSIGFVREASVVAVVVGSRVDAKSLRAGCEHFGHSVPVLAIRCEPGAEAVRRQIGNVATVDVGSLDDLSRVLHVIGMV